MYEEYNEDIKGEKADLKNIGNKGKAGSITAACFLENFVDKKIPWVHIDIAGVAHIERTKSYRGKGATGFGVRLIMDYLENN